MANKNKKVMPNAQKYKTFAQKREVKPSIIKNCLKAFIIGGFVCFIGQIITTFYIHFFDFTEFTAGNPTVATLIFITMLLTGFGVYDRIGQFAGAGTLVPVTGFGNSVISAAIEHKSEGYILGIGGNIFKLAGPVIVYGVFSSFIIALIKIILVDWGGL